MDDYEPEQEIPCFSIHLKQKDKSNPISLSQQVKLIGIKTEAFIEISREPDTEGLLVYTVMIQVSLGTQAFPERACVVVGTLIVQGQ